MAAVALLGLVAAAVIAGSLYLNGAAAPMNSPNNPVTMTNLLLAYSNNTSADSTYAGKTYYFTGTPWSVSRESTSGQIYSDMVLDGSVRFYWKDAGQANLVDPCASISQSCPAVVAKCLLEGLRVNPQGDVFIMLDRCELSK